jgi:RNA polymerase sigma factor (sigma-70 family)
MVKVRTADDNYNNYFYQDDAHKIEGDNHRQEVVFDKGGVATGLSKTQTSPTINPQARERQRNGLKRLTAVFLRTGGKVTLCPPGEPPKLWFGKFKSPSPLRGMSAGDLSQRRWRGPILDARTERELIRKTKSGDEGAKQRLLEAFHRFVLSIVSRHSGPLHNDLMSAGFLGLVEAIGRFNENRGCRLSTYARHWIEKHVRLAVKDWRREGAAGETRQDRFIFSNPRATAEEVVAAVGGTLADAERAIARLDAGHESYGTAEALFDADGNYIGPKVADEHEMASVFGCFSRFSLSPQLKRFEPASKWVDGLARHHTSACKRRLDKIGRRQYALELVSRERVWISYRSKESRYRYRTETDIKQRAQIAARMDSPVYFFDRLPNKPATSTVQQYELDARITREKIARLKALRLAQPQPPTQSKRKRKKWLDTQAMTRRENSFRSRSQPTLPMPRVEFAKTIFGQSHICAEPHYSGI